MALQLRPLHPTFGAELLFRMDRATRVRLLDAISPARAEDLRRMTDYGPRRAGGRLDPRAPALTRSMP